MTNNRLKEITESEQAPDSRVEEMTRQLVCAINAGPMEQREQLREMAVGLLREEVEIFRVSEPAPVAAQAFNPFGIAIPLFLVGSVLIILFPPVGLLLFAAAVIMMAWGVAAVLLVRR